MLYRNIFLVGCALAGFSVSFPAHADDAPDMGGDGRAIIVTAHSAADAAQMEADRTPGGVDVVRYDDYADKSVMSLRDTLAYSPGVYLQPRYGQEVRVSIRGSGISRGYHMRGLTLLQDGVPINFADDNGDFQEMEPIFFDHLQVYRGANALRFGSGTLGGAINGVTPNGKDAKGLYLRADGGSFNTVRGLASFGGASGPADYWVAASSDTSDGDRDHAKRHSLRFNGNVGLALSDAVTTRFYASVNHINQELPGALTLSDATTNPKKGNYFNNQQRDIDSIRLQNRTVWTISEAANVEGGVFVNVKSLYHPIFEVVDQESVDRGGFARVNWTNGPLDLMLGGEIRVGTVASKRFVNLNGGREAQTFEANQKARTANIYGELRYRSIERLTLIAGGIYADGRRRQHMTYSYAPVDRHARVDFSEFSPKFGVLYDAAPDVQFYGNYSRSAEFPGFIELAQTSILVPADSFAPIKAQTAWTAEIGTRGKLGIASWDVSLYRADLRHELLQYSTGGAIAVPVSTFNADKTRHQGVEASLMLQPTDWLQLRQTWQYNDFRFRNDVAYGDNRLPVVPHNVYRAELRLGSDALHVTPNVEWVPRGPWADYANSLRTRGYALIGFSAGAQMSDGIDLFLDARNLTGKKAVGDISTTISASAASTIYYPVERRALFGGVRMRF
tara:strand:+ start:145075 stop:147099 length:2025 start_codon:yes stop_codon:yes gene_type:complete